MTNRHKQTSLSSCFLAENSHINPQPDSMTITAAQKAAIEEVIEIITAATPSRGKRLLSQLFMTLVDRTEWPEYYEVFLLFYQNEHETYSNHLIYLGHTRASMYQQHKSKYRKEQIQRPSQRVHRSVSCVLERFILQRTRQSNCY